MVRHLAAFGSCLEHDLEVAHHITFTYDGSERPALHEVTIGVRPGERLALVGPTGAGKTTIISLLSRFYDVSEGAILIDGHDIRSVEQTSIREQVAAAKMTFQASSC